MKLSSFNGWRPVARQILLGLSAAAILGACSRSGELPQPASAVGTADVLATTTYLGTPVSVGNGSIRSFLTIDQQGVPKEIGLRVTAAALTGLPTTEPGAYTLDLPKRGLPTPYDHLLVDWNPNGHEPDGIYTLPHFDLHFYMTSIAERLAIGPDDPRGDILPPPQYLPAGYVPGPGTVPEMGKHWVNPLSPEFQGQQFTQTFIYGTFAGHVTFIEPMFTLAYLRQVQFADFALPQPPAVAQSRIKLYYPTRYTYRYDAQNQVYEIVLRDLILR